MAFTEEQMQRYSRHLILKGVGVKGQQKLLESKVLVIGGWWTWLAGYFIFSDKWRGNNWHCGW